jgi:hypothetical protein
MPVKLQVTGPLTPTSVVDIQGTWREEKTATLWKVDGIVAQKHKQRSKAVVLSDSSDGIEWGMGNLMGSIEDGLLVWRNRNGQVMYEWGRLEPETVDPPAQSKQVAKINTAARSKGKSAKQRSMTVVKGKPEEAPAHLSSPRSTSSTVSTAPTDTAACFARGATGDPLPGQSMEGTKQKMQTSLEVAQLLEMAGSRLATGDYGTAMQYVLFAQTLNQPEVK